MLRRVLRRRADEAPPSPCWQAVVAALGSGLRARPEGLIQQAIDSFSTFAAGGQEQGVVQHCPVAHSILRCISSAADGLAAPHIAHEALMAAVKRGLQWEQQAQAGGAAGEGSCGCASNLRTRRCAACSVCCGQMLTLALHCY